MKTQPGTPIGSGAQRIGAGWTRYRLDEVLGWGLLVLCAALTAGAVYEMATTMVALPPLCLGHGL